MSTYFTINFNYCDCSTEIIYFINYEKNKKYGDYVKKVRKYTLLEVDSFLKMYYRITYNGEHCPCIEKIDTKIADQVFRLISVYEKQIALIGESSHITDVKSFVGEWYYYCVLYKDDWYAKILFNRHPWISDLDDDKIINKTYKLFPNLHEFLNFHKDIPLQVGYKYFKRLFNVEFYDHCVKTKYCKDYEVYKFLNKFTFMHFKDDEKDFYTLFDDQEIIDIIVETLDKYKYCNDISDLENFNDYLINGYLVNFEKSKKLEKYMIKQYSKIYYERLGYKKINYNRIIVLF